MIKRPFSQILLLFFIVGCTPNVAPPPLTAIPTATEMATSTPTAVPPSPTGLPPTPTRPPLPTATPRPDPTGTPVAVEPIQINDIAISPDSRIVKTLYPAISEDENVMVFHFAEGGYCVLDGCILLARTDRLHAVESEMMAEVATAVENPEANAYVFDSPRVALVMQSHTRQLSSDALQGIRAVTFKTQNLPLVSNSGLRYEFRGITRDGRFLVQAWVPVALPFLPDSSDPLQENQPHFAVPIPDVTSVDEEALFPLFQAYNEAVTGFVDEAADGSFTPDLAAIDALIQSITVAAPPEDN